MPNAYHNQQIKGHRDAYAPTGYTTAAQSRRAGLDDRAQTLQNRTASGKKNPRQHAANARARGLGGWNDGYGG